MKIPFTKMHGAGNDFILVDDRVLTFPLEDKAFIAEISNRRTGIGCDGVLLIQPSETADFRMRFMNPDGGEVDMCGNGGRCIARMAYDLGAAPAVMTIETGAGLVKAEVLGDMIRLELTDPSGLKLDLDAGLAWPVDFVNTGVEHAVAWLDDLQSLDLPMVGKQIRGHALFAPAGTNANFAKVEADGSLSVRTYERGVEAETLACGTGATAVAVIAAEKGWVNLPVTVHCAGGFDLVIDSVQGTTTLTGGAVKTFEGTVEYGNRV
ncbi:diaminopimelate epimerase [Pontiellaceae bacterium B12227]|nr:diaminopimelate epimerase [Pontiellaceae bacterium B12227]